MPENNPFASPQTDAKADVIQSEGASGGVWRLGNLLVVQEGAQLPYRCVRTNDPAASVVRRQFFWQPCYTTWLIGLPMMALVTLMQLPQVRQFLLPQMGGGLFFLFVPLLVIALTATILQKRKTLEIPISANFARSRTIAQATIFLICVAFGIVAYALQSGLVALLGAVAVGITPKTVFKERFSILTPARITKQYAYLKKIHPGYLDGLPEWPSAEFL